MPQLSSEEAIREIREGRMVILVDDEVPFAETMAKRLAKRNIKTITAFNAKECLEKLKENQDLDVAFSGVDVGGNICGGAPCP